MLLGAKEHEMHHRGAADDGAADDRPGAAPDPPDAGAHGARSQARQSRRRTDDAAPRFRPKTLRFLRALKRNNRREWFNAHRDDYEAYVRQPMTAIIERLAVDFRAFAPELVASPKMSMYRIYRDTRFSENKTPYKTHVAAVLSDARPAEARGRRRCTFTSRPTRSGSAAACTRRRPPQLLAVREHIAGQRQAAARDRRVAGVPASSVGALEGERLQRVPRGFPKDHQAAGYLRYRQFLAGREFAPAFATSPRFYAALVDTFKRAAPLIRFLNEPLIGSSG